MSAEPGWKDSLYSTAKESKMECFSVSSKDVFGRPSRLESSFYGSSGYRAVAAMVNSGFPLRRIDSEADILQPPIFKRCYVESPSTGIPYLTGSTIMEAKPRKEVFLSKKLTAELAELVIHKGMILITDSGTIGNTVLVSSELDGWTTTNNLIRVVSRNAGLSQEFLYAFLMSEVGHYLLTRSTYGSVVEHIDPSHVGEIRFPVLPRSLRKELTRLIKDAVRRRVEANTLLRGAETLLGKQTGLDEDSVRGKDNVLSTFVASRNQVLSAEQEHGYARLDATFYEPIVEDVIQNLKRGGRIALLQELVEEIILLGKTFIPGVHKVDQEHGIPYFTGRELFQARPLAQTFIASANAKHLEKLRVKRGTTLITCAGTVGKTMYVRGAFEDAAVTHDAIRVIPGQVLHAGYIYAFLNWIAGRVQLMRCSYGSVIPRLYRTHIERVMVPVPNDRGESVGQLVDRAFDVRCEALLLESDAISLFMEAIKRGREATEAEWGKEY